MSIDNISSISEKDVLELANNSFIVIDVRTLEEYNEGHLNSAIHLPLDILPSKFLSIPKDKTILFYCRSGARSQKALEYLSDRGLYSYNLGGFDKLSDAIIKKLDLKE